MNIKVVIFSTACLTYLAMPAAGTSLLAAAAAIKGAFIGAGLAEAALSSSSGSETVVLQAEPRTIAVQQLQVPAQQVFVQQPVVEFKPVQHVTLIPAGTVSSSYTTNKLSSLWGGISSAINTKTRAVGDFLRSLRGPPRIVLINVDTATKSTPTTKKPTMTTHKSHHLTYEIVAVPEQGSYHLRPSVAVIEDCDKK